MRSRSRLLTETDRLVSEAMDTQNDCVIGGHRSEYVRLGRIIDSGVGIYASLREES